MRPHGRARIDARRPVALAVCDRCQFLFNHSDLQWQMEWRGPKLQNIRLLVCQSCYDTPQEQLRTIILPADPVPVMYPRPPRAAGDGFGPEPSGDTPSPDPNNPLIPP